MANGHVQVHIARLVEGLTFRQPAQLLLNDGTGIFAMYTPAAGPLQEPMVARGATYADYDHDGDLDMLITENNGPAHLWRNETEGGRWLRVRLIGTRSNRDGYGARVALYTDALAQYREVRSDSSYLSYLKSVATFGLGTIDGADSVVVHWPSGITDRLGVLEANQEIEVVEGSTHAE